MFPQHGGCLHERAATDSGEDVLVLVVNISLSGSAITFGALTVVFSKKNIHVFHGIMKPAGGVSGRAATNILHEVIDVLELLQSRPVAIAPPPADARREPNRESLGEVLVGMLLGVGPAI